MLLSFSSTSKNSIDENFLDPVAPSKGGVETQQITLDMYNDAYDHESVLPADIKNDKDACLKAALREHEEVMSGVQNGGFHTAPNITMAEDELTRPSDKVDDSWKNHPKDNIDEGNSSDKLKATPI